jgi:hypothetical protein
MQVAEVFFVGLSGRRPSALPPRRRPFQSPQGRSCARSSQYSSGTVINLRRHRRRHHKHGFLCNACCAIFTSAQNLKEHAEIHKADYCCPKANCGLVFNSASALGHHIRVKHDQVLTKNRPPKLLSCFPKSQKLGREFAAKCKKS